MDQELLLLTPLCYKRRVILRLKYKLMVCCILCIVNSTNYNPESGRSVAIVTPPKGYFQPSKDTLP